MYPWIYLDLLLKNKQCIIYAIIVSEKMPYKLEVRFCLGGIEGRQDDMLDPHVEGPRGRHIQPKNVVHRQHASTVGMSWNTTILHWRYTNLYIYILYSTETAVTHATLLDFRLMRWSIRTREMRSWQFGALPVSHHMNKIHCLHDVIAHVFVK